MCLQFNLPPNLVYNRCITHTLLAAKTYHILGKKRKTNLNLMTFVPTKYEAHFNTMRKYHPQELISDLELNWSRSKCYLVLISLNDECVCGLGARL